MTRKIQQNRIFIATVSLMIASSIMGAIMYSSFLSGSYPNPRPRNLNSDDNAAVKNDQINAAIRHDTRRSFSFDRGSIRDAMSTNIEISSTYIGIPSTSVGISSANDGTQSADGGTQSADGGTQNANGGTQRADGGTQRADGGMQNTDGGTQSADGGTQSADRGTQSADGSTKSADGGTQRADSGTQSADGGTQNTDGGTHSADGGISTEPETNEIHTRIHIRQQETHRHCPVRANLTLLESPASLKYTPNAIPKDLYKLAPNVFNTIPKDFLSGYSSPCWNKDNQLVCLPTFFLAGVGKAGTSDLWVRITSHPHIIEAFKEPRWWARSRLGKRRFGKFGKKKSLMGYLQFFSKLSTRIGSGSSDARMVISGDGSPSTFWDNTNWREYVPSACHEGPTYVLADVIHTVLPQSKIIVIFRNPIDRLYSDYIFLGGKGRSSETFHNHVLESTTKFQSCLNTGKTMRSCVYTFLNWKITGRDQTIMLIKGLYSVFARDWLNVFPRDQLKFIRFEDWIKKCGDILPDIYKFLELDPMSSFNINKICSKKKVNPTQRKKAAGPMLGKTRIILDNFYRASNEDLAHILRDDKWKAWS